MFSFNKSSRILALATILVLALAGVAMAYSSFTPQRTATDTTGDVFPPNQCLPGGTPGGTGLTGWDIDEVGLAYDRASDKLFVGISAYNAIVGDVDGDGDPGVTHACLTAAGGKDYANFGGTESVDFIINDVNAGLPNTYEYIVGMPTGQNITAFGVYAYTGSQPPYSAAGLGYGGSVGSAPYFDGPDITYLGPDSSVPDLEFEIPNFSGYLGLTSSDTLNFCFVARAGAANQDDGFGEDITPAECVTFGLGSIGDYVWNDAASAPFGTIGIQDGSEVGINGVELELWLDNDGNLNVSTVDTPLGTTTTITNTATGKGGWYLFDGLSAGKYIVRIAPAEFDSGGTLYEYTATQPNKAGVDNALDSDGDNPDCPYPCWSDSVWEDNILAATELIETAGKVNDDLTIDFGVQLTGPPTAVTLSSFAAKPSAGGSANWLWLGLAGVTMLAAGSAFWKKRRAG